MFRHVYRYLRPTCGSIICRPNISCCCCGRQLSVTAGLFKDNNNNNPKDNSGDNKNIDTIQTTTTADSRQTTGSDVSVKADDSEVDEYKWGPNEGVPYDPQKDPALTVEHTPYKYPQFFTRQIRQMGLKRAVRIIKDDLSVLKTGRIKRPPWELPPPNEVDVAIFGGGIIGSAIAYFLKQRAPQSFTCCVFERDPTYTRASTTQSIGGIRQQFSLNENILMSMYGIDFLRDVKKHLSVLDNEPPDLRFHPHGHLVLATYAGAQQLVENHKLQTDLGAFVELYTPDKLKEKFPWLNTDGIAIGSYGVQNEGWFDPWALLLAFKTKAQTLGVEYIQGDVLDFNLMTSNAANYDHSGQSRQQVNHVIYRNPDGFVKQMTFAAGIVCGGASSAVLADKLDYGNKPGILSHPLPVEPRKRYVYVFNAPDGPGIDFPLIMDPSSVYCRREGLGGNFICGRNPSEDEEPDVSNLDVDYSYFDTHIYPQLVNRVPAFSSAKIKGAWSGLIEYNTVDQNPIIGRDPYYGNLFWATGFSGQGIQMAPAVGRAMNELFFDNGYQTIDLSRFSWQRILRNEPIKEAQIM
ncbi:FAD-dependent oxidoreductase domain-containing protein 1-like [Oppia nitens]|uniref:FAD-dependent oxidoreductase domain-containing protein 1-like n=1 Tax=Oppia nitens TaxID=1686743 RepID=UPI0023DC19E7|nr:FAD-dependent oxidoreductase domain-containing protein 1-like [Oppia nitens]